MGECEGEGIFTENWWGEGGRGGLLQQLPMSLFKKTINSGHQFPTQCQRKLKFCIPFKEFAVLLIFQAQSYWKNNPWFFFFWFFFFTSVDHYLPTNIFGQPSKKYLIPIKKINPPLIEPTKLKRIISFFGEKCSN